MTPCQRLLSAQGRLPGLQLGGGEGDRQSGEADQGHDQAEGGLLPDSGVGHRQQEAAQDVRGLDSPGAESQLVFETIGIRGVELVALVLL